MTQSIASLALEVDTRQMATGVDVLDAMGRKALAVQQNAEKLTAALKILAKAGEDRGAEISFTSLSNKLTQTERDVIKFYDTWTKAAKDATRITAEQAQEVYLYHQKGAEEYRRSLVQQSRDLQEYTAKQDALLAEQDQQYKLHQMKQAEYSRQRMIQESRDYQEYLAKVKAEQESARRLAAEQYAASPSGIFHAAGVRSPEDTKRELDTLRQARAMWEEAGKGAEGYAGQLAHIDSRINTLVEGNARARGALRQTAAAMASLAFEAAGAAFLVGAVGAAIVAPIAPGVGLMKTIEDTRLGMAGILVSMGRINGMAPDLPKALAISSTMMEKLVNDSMKYGVSIEALANTLRSTLAPGLAAGMNLKQIQEVATIGTIAVKAIGLDSKQTVQEIRDLVAGGIQAASSTLATSLGIKDSDVKRWREGGELYAKLIERLQGFASAAEESTKTLTGAWDVLKTKVAAMMSSEEGFTAIKDSVIAISNYIGEFDKKTGQMKLNPELVASVKAYWDILIASGQAAAEVGGVIKDMAPGIKMVAQTISVMVAELSFMFKMIGGEIATVATQAVAIAHLDFKGAAQIGKDWTKEAEAARVALDKYTASILTAKEASKPISGAKQDGSDVTGNWDTQVASVLQASAPRLKKTREGILAEYQKTKGAITQEEKLVATGLADIAVMESASASKSGKALADHIVDLNAKKTAIATLQKDITLQEVEAAKERDEKLAALSKKENKTSAATSAIDQILKETAGIHAQTAAVVAKNEALRTGVSVEEAIAISYKNQAEAQMRVANWAKDHNGERIKAADAERLINAATVKDLEEYAAKVVAANLKITEQQTAANNAWANTTKTISDQAAALVLEAEAMDVSGKGAKASSAALADLAIAKQNAILTSEKHLAALTAEQESQYRGAEAYKAAAGAYKELAKLGLDADAELAKAQAESVDLVGRTESEKVKLWEESAIKKLQIQADIANSESQNAFASGDVVAMEAAERAALAAEQKLADKTTIIHETADQKIANFRQKEMIASQKKIETALQDSFIKIGTSFLDGSKSALDSAKSLFGDFKTFILKEIVNGIYEAFLKKQIVIPISVAITGMMGGVANAAENSLVSAGTNSLLSNASSALGLSSLPFIGTALSNVGTAASTFSTMLGQGAGVMESFSAAAAGMGPSLLSLAGPIGIGVGLLAASGIFSGEGDAQRSGNWSAKLGQSSTPGKSGNSLDNHWFSGDEMNASLDAFAAKIAESENSLIKNLGLSTTQIDAINAQLAALGTKQYGFGMEHTDWTQSQADEQIVADRTQAIASALGLTIQQLADQMSVSLDSLKATYNDAVLSDTEKLALKTADVQAQFAALGLSMPATITDYRNQVKAQEALGDSAKPLLRELYKLAPAFAEVAKATNGAQQAAFAEVAKATNGAQQASRDAMSGAFTVLQKSVAAERSAITTAYDASIATTQKSIDALGASVSRLSGLSNALKAAINGMSLAGAESADRALAQAQISAALVIAKAGGVLPDEAALSNALSVVAKPSEALFTNFVDYQRDFALTKNSIIDLNDVAERQLNKDTAQVDLLNAQLAATRAGYDAEMVRLDKIVSDAQAQIDAINGTTAAVLSVADAMANFKQAASVAVPVVSGGSAPNALGASSIADLYQINLGRAPDAAGLAYWTEQFGGSISQNEAQQFAIAAMPEYLANHSFATGINAGILPSDQIIQAHGGEEIKPAPFVRLDNEERKETLRLMRELVAENTKLREEIQAGNIAIASNTGKTAKILDRAIGQGEGSLAVKVIA